MNKNSKSTKSLYDIFFDICIIGGGASGFAAAINAAEENPTLKICVVEKKSEPLKKLLATGNGKCNITNRNSEGFEIVAGFLEKCGVLLKEEAEGRMYPYSEQASAVAELLKNSAKKLNIAIFTDCNVINIENAESNFRINIDCAEERVFIPCSRVILACGGKAGPQFGTSGDGYSLAKKLGHSVLKVSPVLMPLECEGIQRELKGVRAKGRVSLLKGEQVIAEETGEVQFTEDGISGICVFNLTRHIKLDQKRKIVIEEQFKEYMLEVDFLPDMEEFEVMERLEERRANLAGIPVELFLCSVVNMKLGRVITDSVVGNEIDAAGNLSYESLEEIAMLLKSSRYTVTGAKGWKEAQCTKGGIPTEEFDGQNMESHLQKGLYFSGEVIDFDGPCGGYNLNHAWLTGMKAGIAAARSFNVRNER